MTQGKLPGILKLAQQDMSQVSSADVDTTRGFDHEAAYFRIVEVDGKLVGLFAIAVAQNS